MTENKAEKTYTLDKGPFPVCHLRKSASFRGVANCTQHDVVIQQREALGENASP